MTAARRGAQIEVRVSQSSWQLLITLSDVPSAQVFAHGLAADGIGVRVVSDANVLGQAAPCRVYVAAAQIHHAPWSLARRSFTDAELTFLSTGEHPPDGEA
jgi:hypothetical protein